MLLNKNKTALLHFSLESPDHSLLVWDSGESVPIASSTKFLGVHLQSNWRWDMQIKYTMKKLNGTYYSMYKLRDIVEPEAVRTYYFANVESMFSYGILIWGSSTHLFHYFVLKKFI